MLKSAVSTLGFEINVKKKEKKKKKPPKMLSRTGILIKRKKDVTK